MFARHRTAVITAIKPETSCQQAGPCSNPLRFIGKCHGTQQHAVGPIGPIGDHVHAVVDAIAHINVKTSWLTKERFVAGGAAVVAVAGGVVLGIRLRFHHHTPEQTAVCLAFHQPATDEVGTHDLGGTGEERER